METKLAGNSPAEITARIDRLPACWTVWRLVVLLSLGAFFEMYDLFQTAYVSPGLISSGIFRVGAKGLFGLTDQATFAAATFAGLFAGTILLGSVADKYGRRTIFTYSMLWYTVANVAMGLQHTNVGVDLWRFTSGVGIGVELVTIDAYISEFAPRHIRGRAFALNQCVQFLAIPGVALASYILVPRSPFGVTGWRWVVFLGAFGAIAVWFIRRGIHKLHADLAELAVFRLVGGRIAQLVLIAERLIDGREGAGHLRGKPREKSLSTGLFGECSQFVIALQEVHFLRAAQGAARLRNGAGKLQDSDGVNRHAGLLQTLARLVVSELAEGVDARRDEQNGFAAFDFLHAVCGV